MMPLCAWCGESMTAVARGRRAESAMVMLDHPGEPSRPRYGWHWDCEAQDPLSIELLRGVGVGTTVRSLSLKVIAERGPGRVVVRKPR